MKYAIAFFAFSVTCAAWGVRVGGAGFLLFWPAVSFAVVAAAYAVSSPWLLGKQPSGRLNSWAVALLLPYFLPTWGVWYVQRALSAEAAANEIIPGIWVGRRPLPRDVPAGVRRVVDLTAEFHEPCGVVHDREYLCLPTLDAAAGRDAGYDAVVDSLTEDNTPTYIQCAQGYGRSAAFAAAAIVLRGAASDVAAADQLIRRARPGVRLSATQRLWAQRLVAAHHERSAHDLHH